MQVFFKLSAMIQVRYSVKDVEIDALAVKISMLQYFDNNVVEYTGKIVKRCYRCEMWSKTVWPLDISQSLYKFIGIL